ncbi:AMP-binding protein [Aeromicrobium chenweiae]|nr:AMP-binding protein [Aeromicrobium chenweiae]
MTANMNVSYTPTAQAALHPDHPAQIMAGSGKVMTYAELDAESARIARLLRERGLRTGDHVALLVGNHERTLQLCWAAQRSGLYWTPLNTRWTVDELTHVVSDSGAAALFVAADFMATGQEIAELVPALKVRIGLDGGGGLFEGLEQACAGLSGEPLDDESEGCDMLYSSGTTGKPKGVKPGSVGAPFGTLDATTTAIRKNHGMTEDSVFLAATPLFHVAALASALTSHRIGGIVVVLERFGTTAFLSAVETFGVTHTMVVPTILSRLLEVPEESRAQHDLSSLVFVGHGGAPCPVSIKDRSLEWLGPIVYDCWGATERPGLTMIGPDEWPLKKGSIGRPISGVAHVLDEQERELPPGEVGYFYWSGNKPFEYHHDPVKTAASRDHRGWCTVGDMGYIDEDGYLFITDRAAHMIITGGENVYPLEVENLLVEHPRVRDVAVIGRDDADYGQRVVAVIEPTPGDEAGSELAEELLAFCRKRLAGYKCPRTIEFLPHLPRSATGKLVKRLLI